MRPSGAGEDIISDKWFVVIDRDRANGEEALMCYCHNYLIYTCNLEPVGSFNSVNIKK